MDVNVYGGGSFKVTEEEQASHRSQGEFSKQKLSDFCLWDALHTKKTISYDFLSVVHGPSTSSSRSHCSSHYVVFHSR